MLSTKTPNELARQQLKEFEPVAKEWGYSKTQSEIEFHFHNSNLQWEDSVLIFNVGLECPTKGTRFDEI